MCSHHLNLTAMHTIALYHNDLMYDHARWENELDFYKREIGILEDHLGDLILRDLSQDMLIKVEQYQNRFIRQKEVLDELTHQIHLYEDELEGKDPADKVSDVQAYLPRHREMAQQIHRFHDLYMELRADFNAFLVQVLQR